MKITIYELLGLIKDGKAPKKIKYREMIHHICYEYGDYESDIEEYRFADTKEHYYLFEGIDMLKCLNDEVEIIEEDDKIKKLIPTSLKGIDNLDEKIEVAHLDTVSAIDKINELMDEVNKLKGK